MSSKTIFFGNSMVAKDFVHVNNNAVFHICFLFSSKTNLSRHEIGLVLENFTVCQMRYINRFRIYLFSHLFGFHVFVFLLWNHNLFGTADMSLKTVFYVLCTKWYILSMLYTVWSVIFVCIPHFKCYWLVDIEVVFFCKLTMLWWFSETQGRIPADGSPFQPFMLILCSYTIEVRLNPRLTMIF